MTMDAEALELLLAEVKSMWPRPLDDYEIGQWKRTLAGLDPELVAQVLLDLHHREDFEFVRPPIAAFKSYYDRAFASTLPPPPDPEMASVSRERAHEHIAAAREALKPKPATEPETAGRLL